MSFNEIRKFNVAINTLNKYFSYLRKKKRGNLSFYFDRFEIKRYENTNIKNIQKLVTDTLKGNYKCFECGFTYTKIDDYFEKLPFIFLGMDTDSVFITEIFCNSCREEMMKKLFKKEM